MRGRVYSVCPVQQIMYRNVPHRYGHPLKQDIVQQVLKDMEAVKYDEGCVI